MESVNIPLEARKKKKKGITRHVIFMPLQGRTCQQRVPWSVVIMRGDELLAAG